MPRKKRRETSHHYDSYLTRVFAQQGDIVKDAKRLLKGIKFDTVVGRGVSGIIGATLVARAMRKNLLIVRKPGDSSHSDNKGDADGILGERWLFVDDIISTGDTLSATKKRVNLVSQQTANPTEFAGAYLFGTRYSEPEYRTAECA